MALYAVSLHQKKRVLRSSAGDVNKSSSGERLREKRRCVSWGKQTEIDLFKKNTREKSGQTLLYVSH